jgi:integrase
LIEEYGQFLREVRGLAQSTIAQHRFTVIEFLTGTVEPTQPVSTLGITHVESYLSRKAGEVTRQTLQHTVAHLRAFLRYSFERGLIHERLDVIDTPRAYRGERPPRAMPWPLVLQLLASIDRTSRAGWRDYTILHLMAHYGLRPSEIVALAVESVDFDDRTLRVEQRKHPCLVSSVDSPVSRC